MAVIDYTRAPVVTQPFGGFSVILRNALAGFKTWNNIRMTRKALEALSDHELTDIGLIRGEIEFVARRTYS